MTLARGHSLSFYEILAPLGAGGMGEVYRARDTRLEREVAIKVLPEELAGDEDRLRRFEREAKTLASLNHPNVAGIHGVGQEGDTCFLALELVPGEDLAARLARGPLPIDEALDTCRQIAEGLEAAHEAGVIHRDLKPANVRVTPDGIAKVLDFGLAKPLHPKQTAEGTSTAESDSFLVTEEGLVLGTPTYMSPEQARGKPVDRRTDVWAFGCVLYECLTGKRAFDGDSMTDVLAAIVGDEPDWSRVPDVPPRVMELLERTLTKDPRERLRDIGEARVVLQRARTEPTSVEPASKQAAPRALVGVTLVGLALAGGFFAGRFTAGGDGATTSGAAPAERSAMFAVFQAFDETEYPDGIVISPYGRALAWHRSRELWVRRIDELEPRLIYTGDVNSVCWSPDGRELAFAGERAAWRISAEGGRPARVADMQWGGLSWQENDRLIVSEAKSIWSVSLTGQEREVHHFESGEPDAPDHWHFTHVLPDGAGLIGLLHRASEPFDRIEHFRGDEKPRTIIQIEDGELAGASLAADGTLAYTVEVDGEWSIWSARLSLEGPAGPTLLDVPRLRVAGARHFSLSASGTLAYLLSDDDDGDIQMGWLSLEDGAVTGIGRPLRQLNRARLSRDRDRIVFVTGGMSRSEYWVHDLERDFSTPAFKRDGFSMNMVWLPDGRIGVSSFTGTVGTFAHELTGRNEPELISDDIIAAVSGDGRHYVRSTMRMPNFDDPGVYISGPDFDAEPIATLRDGDNFVRLSRDDDWMLFESERTGTDQLYLSRFPPDDDQDWPVALTGSDDAWFRDDLSAIYYVEVDREIEQTTVFRVALTVEPEVRLGVPEVVQEFSSSTRVTDFDGDDRLLVVTGAARGPSRVYIDTAFSTRE